MRRLIINADDFGAYPQRSRGILDAWENGVVTSTTLICNGGDAENAAHAARERGLPTGVHLNLTHGAPMNPKADVASLLGADGLFRERAVQWRALEEGHVEATHIERELRTQLEWFMKHCGQPTHVDGHQHIHVHPAVASVLGPVLKQYGITRVRIPNEQADPPFAMPDDQRGFVKLVSAQAEEARTVFAACGIRGTEHFLGMYLLGHASPQRVRDALAALPDGTAEYMVHPGRGVVAGGWFDTHPQREAELALLIDPALPDFLAAQRIELISYRDLL